MVASQVKYEEPEGVEIEVTVLEKPKNDTRKPKTLSQSATDLLSQERFWASLAHAFSPLMIVLMFVGNGFMWLGAIVLTAAIYLYWSDKSESVKMHARQALAAQLIGSLGWISILIGGTLAWVILLIISVLLILVLVGLLLLPLVALSYPLFILATFALPAGAALFGIVGAWETWQGRDFRYPRLADWLDKRFGATQQVIVV